MSIDGTVSTRAEERREVIATRLAPDKGAPSRARRLVSEAVRFDGDGGLDDALLMVSELVTNACVHTGSEITLHVYADAEVLRVEVGDSGDLPPVLEEWDGRAGGLGLQLVDQLSDRWGWEPGPGGGKVVWFERRTVAFESFESFESKGRSGRRVSGL
jgi:anti-sigma regulatory factor (Ser/Thr protein kinase)